MANIFDTAAYILEKTGNTSFMKLQKLCYYCQAWSLVWDDKPLFDEEFRAWESGAVCEELYHKTEGGVGEVSSSIVDGIGFSANLTEEQKDTIDHVLDYYGDKTPYWLCMLTRMEDPWKEAKEKGNDSKTANIITKESMAMYYGSL